MEISVEACSQQVSVLEPAAVFVAAGLCVHRREELLCLLLFSAI